MNDFDQLLHEVLHQDANPELPSGLPNRVIASLASEGRVSRTQVPQKLWLACAAAILLGLIAAWPAPHMPSVSQETRVVPVVAPSSPLPRLATMQKISRRHPRPHKENAPSIAPVAIQPLAIQPIEIAHLQINKLTHERELP